MASKISLLKKEIDILFRKYLLSKAARNTKGLIKCPLTKKWLPPARLDVCHFIDRKWLGTRWDTDNCILCSTYTNQFESSQRAEGFKSLHHKRFEEYLGREKITELEKKKEKKLTEFELLEIKNRLVI
jgi:hypothetical protein